MKSPTLFSDYCDQSNCDMAVVAKPSEQCKTEFQFILLVLKVTLLTFKSKDKEELRTMKYSPINFCFFVTRGVKKKKKGNIKQPLSFCS